MNSTKSLFAALLLFATPSFAANLAIQAAPVAVEEVTAAPSTKISCLLGLADNLDAQLILTATESTFSVLQPSSTGHSIETVYEKAPIAIFMPPVEAPVLECSQADSQIVMWENLALVNGQYFSISNATAINEN